MVNENHSREPGDRINRVTRDLSGEKLAKLVRFGRERLAGDRKLEAVARTFPAKCYSPLISIPPPLSLSLLPPFSRKNNFLKTSLFRFQIAPIKIPFSIRYWTLASILLLDLTGGLKIVRRWRRSAIFALISIYIFLLFPHVFDEEKWFLKKNMAISNLSDKISIFQLARSL